MKLFMKPKVDVEFERSAEGQPTPPADRNPVDPDHPYPGQSALDQPTEVDAERETEEWEKRYGTEESRGKVGFDGG